ncbi:MAG: hypothetical protein U5K53_07840 [Halanaerobiales bacterium]|nr:hypothetical protein [Halanaerobiales bacterium]
MKEIHISEEIIIIYIINSTFKPYFRNDKKNKKEVKISTNGY